MEKRRDERMDSIARRLSELEQKVDELRLEDLRDNEAFVSTVMHASQAALRSHQKEKLDALRNAVLNAALPNAPDDDLQLMVLNYIDSLTPGHLRILTFFENPRRGAAREGIEFPRWTSGGP